jgi:hypothetical protein
MRKIDVDIIPLLISAILIVVSIVVISTSDYALNVKHYIGFSCFVISTFFYFKNRIVYLVIFGLTNVAGVFGLLDFYYTTYRVGFGSFGINPIFILLLVLLFVFAYHIAKKLDSI